MLLDLGDNPVGRLTDMLIEAERAHGVYEQRLGHADANWAAWYARHIVDRAVENESSRSE
mgnify:CR=1 FL=1